MCSQFLRGYVNISILRDIQPEDIEDVSSRYGISEEIADKKWKCTDRDGGIEASIRIK